MIPWIHSILLPLPSTLHFHLGYRGDCIRHPQAVVGARAYVDSAMPYDPVVPMTETESKATRVERRRSQRIPFSLAVYVVDRSPSLGFIKRSEIVEVSSHGCQLLAPSPLPRGSQVRLDRRTRVALTTAHVIHSTPVEPIAVKIWRIGLELVAPGNVWGIAEPPADWVTPP